MSIKVDFPKIRLYATVGSVYMYYETMKKDMGQQGKVPDYLEPYVFECHRHELR